MSAGRHETVKSYWFRRVLYKVDIYVRPLRIFLTSDTPQTTLRALPPQVAYLSLHTSAHEIAPLVYLKKPKHLRVFIYKHPMPGEVVWLKLRFKWWSLNHEILWWLRASRYGFVHRIPTNYTLQGDHPEFKEYSQKLARDMSTHVVLGLKDKLAFSNGDSQFHCVTSGSSTCYYPTYSVTLTLLSSVGHKACSSSCVVLLSHCDNHSSFNGQGKCSTNRSKAMDRSNATRARTEKYVKV
jgi:hypothetical protein